MSTPRKMFNNYTSPYAKPVQQYPSQSEDYISLDMGGRSQPQQAGSNEKTPGGYMNTKHFQNSNSKSNRGKNLFNNNNNTGNRYNRPNYNNQQDRYTPRKNNEFQQQERYTPRKNDFQHQDRYTPRKTDYQQERYTPRKNNDNYQNRNQNNVKHTSPSIAAYCHPTMTQDPWLELMERVQAIGRSKISIKTSPSQNDATTEAEESALPDSDEQDDGGDSVASE